jgi:hypothetical protein
MSARRKDMTQVQQAPQASVEARSAEARSAEIRTAEARKLKQVKTVKEVVETANSYLVAKPRNWRVVLTITNFNDERLKIRINQPVGGRFITVVNVNYDRLQDLINLLMLVKQKLEEAGAKDKFLKQATEEIL